MHCIAALRLTFARSLSVLAAFSLTGGASASAADDTLARVRANGVVHCAGIVRPGIAVPTPDGSIWSGIAPDMCRAIAAAVFGDARRFTFRPYLVDVPREASSAPDDVVFLGSAELLAQPSDGRAASDPGPVIVHDAIALLVPSGGVSTLPQLSGKTICVEPGSPADRALTRYFDEHALTLHEHPFQETDEMRQAYGDGKCDALAGPRSTLASVRADPKEGRPADRILPDVLADDPIFAAIPGDTRFARVVWWTFSALVDAERDGIAEGAPANVIPGVPPLVGQQLGLSPSWARDVVSAEGNYGEMIDRNLGAGSRYRLVRGPNALAGSDGGLIFGLSVE